MKKHLFTSIILISLLFLHSCSATSGNGTKGDKNIVEKVIPISEYNSIEFALAGDIFYEQNESTPAYLRIEIDNNLLENLDINVTDKILKINPKGKVSNKPSKFNIYTNSKTLKAISISGVSKVYARKKVKTEDLRLNISGVADIFFDNLESDKTDCSISGVGNINVTGTANSSNYNVSGCGDINADKFVVNSAECKISGVGNIKVNTKNDLQATISGMGDIKYAGNPEKISQSVSGMGKIKSIK